jgi:ankyrin repeat protein
MLALYQRQTDEVKRLLADEPELDVFEAAALGRAPLLVELLDADISLTDAWSDDGFTALHLASFFGHPLSVRRLLDAGADPSAVSRNDMGVQPLHSAAAANSVEVCALLLHAGADPNATQKSGHTAMDEAVLIGNAEMQKLLRDHGATA